MHDQPRADGRWLWSYVIRRRSALIGAVVSGVFGGIFGSVEPFMIGVIIDHVREGAPMTVILQDVLLILFFAVITVAAFYGQRFFSGQIAYNVIYDVRRDLYDNLLALDQRFYHRYSAGDLISRMHSDMDMIWRLMAIGNMRLWSSLTVLLVTFILLAAVNLTLTLVVFCVLLVSTAFQVRAGMVLAPVFEQVQDQGGVLSAHVQDAFSGIGTIKTFGREAGSAARYAEANTEYRRRWLYFRRRNEPVGMLPNMISQLTTGIVVLFGGIMTVQGLLTLGNFAQFLVYLTIISFVLLNLGAIFQRYQQTRGVLARITPILSIPAIRDHEGAIAVPVTASRTDGRDNPDMPAIDIDFQGVSLVLEGDHVLDGIDLHIPAGQVVAFVGPTGCGKTLLVNLLGRVDDVTEGSVRMNGVDVRDVALSELRRHIAYVPQSTFLFSDTLAENVRMSNPSITEGELERAMRISRLVNDLPQLPQGVETLVGEKGVMLSGGQKQRVAIARAIARDPSILVLDDALSSIDTQTSAEILGELRAILGGSDARARTSFIIAQRIATVKDADRIIVMDQGRIIEDGTHDDLLHRGGLYAQMVARELREGAPGAL